MKKFMIISIYGMILALTFSLLSCDSNSFMELLGRKKVTIERSAIFAFRNTEKTDGTGATYIIRVTEADSSQIVNRNEHEVSFSHEAAVVNPGETIEIQVDWSEEIPLKTNQNPDEIKDYKFYDVIIHIMITKVTSTAAAAEIMTEHLRERSYVRYAYGAKYLEQRWYDGEEPKD